jgi:hypothetical protein
MPTRWQEELLVLASPHIVFDTSWTAGVGRVANMPLISREAAVWKLVKKKYAGYAINAAAVAGTLCCAMLAGSTARRMWVC